MYTLDRLTVFRSCLQAVGDVNTFDNEDTVLFFDFATHLARQMTITGGDSARFQRATKGAGQSATGGGDHII